MDVGYKSANGNFSLRAAALIIRENKLLLAKSDKYDCYYTVGGGIQQNESSDNAVLRECYEETGCHFEIDRLVFIQERFFTLENRLHHEVVFFYLMKETNYELYSGKNTDQKNEHLFWVPIEELDNINLAPAFLKTAVNNIPDGITRIVSQD